jgi:hypothetical protein
MPNLREGGGLRLADLYGRSSTGVVWVFAEPAQDRGSPAA